MKRGQLPSVSSTSIEVLTLMKSWPSSVFSFSIVVQLSSSSERGLVKPEDDHVQELGARANCILNTRLRTGSCVFSTRDTGSAYTRAEEEDRHENSNKQQSRDRYR